MCKVCVDAVKELFPDCPARKRIEFLSGSTAFPLADAKTVIRQLKEHKRYGADTWIAAMIRCDRLMDKHMKKYGCN